MTKNVKDYMLNTTGMSDVEVRLWHSVLMRGHEIDRLAHRIHSQRNHIRRLKLAHALQTDTLRERGEALQEMHRLIASVRVQVQKLIATNAKLKDENGKLAERNFQLEALHKVAENTRSAQPCGCDPGAGWKCSAHMDIKKRLVFDSPDANPTASTEGEENGL